MKSRGADRLSLLASYIAALVHDFEHSGVNNDFLIKTSHDLAITYNLQSPLENHHRAHLYICVSPAHDIAGTCTLSVSDWL